MEPKENIIELRELLDIIIIMQKYGLRSIDEKYSWESIVLAMFLQAIDICKDEKLSALALLEKSIDIHKNI